MLRRSDNKDMQSGDVLLAFSDEISNLDKVSMKNDIPAFCRQTGNELLSWETPMQKDTLAFYIKKR
ncbi:MAG: sulfurtransferase TusA family protein [bacterium]